MNATRFQLGFLAAAAVVGALAGGQALMLAAADKKPADSEFGFGPRASAAGTYSATLIVAEPLRPRTMYTLTARITDAAGAVVDDANIAVDGGMPQHRHGLPTRPRVTKRLGDGRYEIEGVRFNMSGWWELRLAITATAGADVVTFNLDIGNTHTAAAWTPDEVRELTSLWLGSLEPLPPDPSNRFADDAAAAELGRKLFFDTRLSSNGQVSCATCHQPERDFQDGTALATGVGTTNRRTMPIAGTAYAPFLFWDGRKDSLWSQALGPLESIVEHGGTRRQYAALMASHYRSDYEAVFGGMPAPAAPDGATEVFVNMGKAIAAYERRIEFRPSRFDAYVERLLADGTAPAGVLTTDEVAGLKLFVGRANCTQCHNGPLFTNNEFHNTGVPPALALPPDRGRFAGIDAVTADEFNCRSRWSDAEPSACRELEFMMAPSHDHERAFKVPSLRDVARRPPYMHAGQLATLGEVLDHYNRAPKAPAGHTELQPLKLHARERRQLEAFLRALSGGTRDRLRPEGSR